MATVTLNAYSKAYPSISVNRIRASVLSWDRVTVIDSITEDAPHNARLWSFAGLPRNNYVFSLDEINGAGTPINNLADFDVTPAELDGSIVRDAEQYQVGAVGSGMTAGASSATFDGTSGSPDFRSWNIVVSIYGDARGILIRGLDYSWDEVTGVLALLQTGDVFTANSWVTFQFEPKENTAGNSVPSVFDYSLRLVDSTGSINYDDFGNAIIVEPSGVYIELTLPLITTVPVGRPLKVIFGTNALSCARILPFSGDQISFLKGNIYGYPGESIEIVRYLYGTGVNQWKVVNSFGNFARVGDSVQIDQIQANVLNAKLLDGSSELDTLYARIYNEVVLNLPLTQVCNYDDWATGNNKYLFSLANSANPANAGKFRFPDRRGLTLKGNLSGKSGDFEDWQMPTHRHEGTSGTLPSTLFGRGALRIIGQYFGTTSSQTDLTGPPVDSSGVAIANLGSETKVKSVLINQYILI